MTGYEEFLLQPLLESCRGLIGIGSPHRTEMLSYLLWCDLAFTNYDKNRVNSLRIFSSMRATFETSVKTMTEDLQILQK